MVCAVEGSSLGDVEVLVVSNVINVGLYVVSGTSTSAGEDNSKTLPMRYPQESIEGCCTIGTICWMLLRNWYSGLLIWRGLRARIMAAP